MRLALSCLLLVGSLVLASSPALAASSGDKAGPIMVNLKLGASVPVYVQDYRGNALDAVPAAFALQLEGGVALDRERRLYVVLPFEIHVGSRSSSNPFGGATTTFTKIIVPLGLQYDIPIRPVPGLYIYPRVSFGYAAYLGDFSGSVFGFGLSGRSTFHGGMLAPELGIKYVWRRAHFGLEPFSLPVHFFAVDQGGSTQVKVYLDYRVRGYVGVDF